ncbi:MAG: hypothetical protein V4466_08080 [Pseudomonadota bacterium]
MNRAALEALYAALAPALMALDAPWCVIGSGAAMIAGAPVEACPDVDIMTTAAGAAALEAAWEAWRDRVYAPTSGELFRSRFSGYAFPEGRVEVMGDLLLRGEPVAIPAGVATPFAGVVVRIPTIEAQIALLQLFGRPKDLAKADMLEAYSNL